MSAESVELKVVGKNYWNEGDILVFSLDGVIYTYAQMFGTSHLRFFSLFWTNNQFKPTDLDSTATLFTVPVLAIARKGEKPKIVKRGVKSSSRPLENLFIYPKMSFGKNSVPWLGGNLVDMTGIQGSGGWNAPIVKEDLDAQADREEILQHELVNMWSPEDLTHRLQRFLRTGVNIDQLKYKIFPGLVPLREPDEYLR